MGSQAKGTCRHRGQRRGDHRDDRCGGRTGARRGRGGGRAALATVAGTALLLPLLLAGGAGAEGSKLGDWWSENVDVHGFLTSKAFFRTPDFAHEVVTSSWRNELNVETEMRLHEDDFRLGLFGVFRPVWDGVYAIQRETWGMYASQPAYGTAPAFPDDPFTGAQLLASPPRSFAESSGSGKSLPCPGGGNGCEGARVDGEFTLVNSDTGSYFSGRLAPAIAVDDVLFYGRVTGPVLPRSSRQPAVGGNATGHTYEELRDHFGDLIPGFRQGEAFYGALHNGGLGSGEGINRSLQLASMPLGTPLNSYQGSVGSQRSFEQSPFDINRRQERLAFDCLDNAHPWCFVREFYLEGTYKNTFVRVGRQQIVWGKTDAFRLQDRINPVDLSYHNIFPDLEERRIPLLALDVIQSLGDVGPFEDVSLEFAWVFDRFIPDQLGQCGEPYAFTAACGARADAGAHGLFNFSLAGVDEIPWRLENTEPGLRLDFRLPDPSIAFSLSAFYTFQDQPVARFKNHYSASNPNPAVLLFLQGLYSSSAGRPLANVLEAYAGGFAAMGTTPLSQGFDPYAHDANGNPTGTLAAANQVLLTAWSNIFNVFLPTDLLPGCRGLSGSALADCAGGFALFALPWSASEAVLEYPRIWALGASMDYQIPRIDTVLRMELASDIDRRIQDTSRRDGVSNSDVFLAAVGLDRSTFIPFLNRERTAFITLQTFVEHIVHYRDRGAKGGMIPYNTSVISTAAMQNFWRNDSIVLTNFAAYDWLARALALGPSLRWFYNSNFFVDVGANFLFGQTRQHNIRNVCADATIGCIADPTTWQDGNWQTLNRAFALEAEHPWWAQESFADKLMRHRDEFWVGMTYQF